ncbi:MAG: ATP-binding protein [Verrucomicrobiales bacterium]|nr:ATP-binding protein [Verrucomicrobiales bacterium]
MAAPTWSETIRRLYLSGAANQFILHGNVADRLLVPGGSGPSTGSLTDFLTKEQLRRFDIVIGFELGSGVRVLAGEELFRQIAPPGNPPTTPAQVVGWLDHFLRLCVNLRGLAPSAAGTPGVTGKNHAIAIVIGAADLLFPVAKQVRDYELNSMASVVRSWSHETHFLEQHLAVFLLTEHLNDLNHLLSQNPRAALVEVPLPDEETLVEVFRHFAGRFPMALRDFADRPDFPAARLAGATVGSIESLLKQREYAQTPLGEADLSDLKKSLVEKDAQGLIEFLEPSRTLDDVHGSDAVKAWMRQDLALWREGDLAAMPMGYLLSGPVGTGKTYFVECLAGEAGVPVVKLKNFRDRWVGSTESNLEKIFGLLRALGRCIVFIDEADQALGSRDAGSGDSGLSGRVYSMMAKEMSNTANRGRILWILASSRPDLIEVDLKRPGRVDVKFPLFPALDAAEAYALIRALGKKHQLALPKECPEDLLPLMPDHVTPGAAEALAIKIYRQVKVGGLDPLAALRDCLDDYQNPIAETTMRFQIGLAVKEASDLAFVPEVYRHLAAE